MSGATRKAVDAYALMSTRALNSPTVQHNLKDIPLNYASLRENLRG